MIFRFQIRLFILMHSPCQVFSHAPSRQHQEMDQYIKPIKDTGLDAVDTVVYKKQKTINGGDSVGRISWEDHGIYGIIYIYISG